MGRIVLRVTSSSTRVTSPSPLWSTRTYQVEGKHNAFTHTYALHFECNTCFASKALTRMFAVDCMAFLEYESS